MSSEDKIFKFRSLNRTFNTSFTKITGSAEGNSKLDGCETMIDNSGKIVCGRQITPITVEEIKALFNKKEEV